MTPEEPGDGGGGGDELPIGPAEDDIGSGEAVRPATDIARQVRVVLVDDHPIWRSGVRSDLGELFHVVGEASDADEAGAVIARTRPDLVVCDLHMPNGGGIKVARTCGEQTRIVMLTVSEAERDLLDAVAAGAQGYLVKSTPPDELRAALWRAASGRIV